MSKFIAWFDSFFFELLDYQIITGLYPFLERRNKMKLKLVLCSLVLFVVACEPSPKRIHSGFVDLRKEFKNDKTVLELRGDWEFYWNQLLRPGDPYTNLTGYYFLPQNWSSYEVNGEKLPPHGYATFRLTIVVPEKKTKYALRFGEIVSASEIWINGELVHKAGVLGKNRKEHVPYIKPDYITFEASGPNLEIVLLISNYTAATNSAWNPIYFGLEKDLIRDFENGMMVDFVIVGIFLAFAFYMGVMMLRQPKNLFWTYSFLFILFYSFRQLFTPNYLFFYLFPGHEFPFYGRSFLVAIFTSLVFLYLLIYHLFREEINRKIFYSIVGFLSLQTITVLILPVEVYFNFLNIIFLELVLLPIYFTVITYRSFLKRKPYSFTFFLGFILLNALIFNDILFILGLISTGIYGHFGSLILVSAHMVMITINYQKTIAKSEELNKELKIAIDERDLKTNELLEIKQEEQKNLEKIVFERTRELKTAMIELSLLKDEAIQANQAKSKFLANMSHEIRTPMNGILGIVNIILSSDLNVAQKEMLELVKNSGESLLVILNDILDYSKIEAKKLDLEIVEFSLIRLINELYLFYLPFANQKDLDFLLRIDSTLPEKVYGDPNRIRQVLTNLIMNAIKFTEKGRIEIICEFAMVPEGAKFQFKIHDTGIGIKEDDLHSLFREFTQVDSSSTRKFGGTGLGLVITKNLVQLMNGDIIVKSEYGKGSSFICHIILQTEASENKNLDSSSSAEKKTISNLIKILVVEDDKTNQFLAKKIFEKFNLKVDLAENGKLAIEMTNKTKYDLIFMDIMMPEMDGYSATTEIMKNPENKHLKIIGLSANVFEEDKLKGLKSGMVDFIGKPYSPEQIRDCILRWT